MAETTLLQPSSIPGPFTARQRVLFLDDDDQRAARVLPRYKKRRKLSRRQQTDQEKDRISAISDSLLRPNTGTAEDANCTDESLPQETKPLLIVDVGNVSDVSGDCPSTPSVVDRARSTFGQ